MHILVTSAGSALAQQIIQGLAIEHGVRATDRQAIVPPMAVPAASHGQGLATEPNGGAGRRTLVQEVPMALSPLGHDLSTNLLVRGVDAIVHCAEPQAGESAESYLDYTTRCTYNLMMAASSEGVGRVIYLSTLALMAPYPAEYAVTERWRPLPSTDANVMGKYLGEMVCREFAREFKVPVIVLRLGTVVERAAQDDTALQGEDLDKAITCAINAAVPRWTVVHVQSEFAGARFGVGDAKKVLGFDPGKYGEAMQREGAQ